MVNKLRITPVSFLVYVIFLLTKLREIYLHINILCYVYYHQRFANKSYKNASCYMQLKLKDDALNKMLLC